MAAPQYESNADQRRPPPVVITELTIDSPSGAGALVPVPAGAMMFAPQSSYLPGGAARLPPAVANTLSALAGPAERRPLVYTGDTAGSLAALRQDLTSSYHALCGVLGDAPRLDLVTGSLPAAAALGLNLPAPAAVTRLPPLLGPGAGLSGTPSAGARGPSLLLGAPGAASPGGGGGVAMALGPSIGIEGVGSGADAPGTALGPLMGGGVRGAALGGFRSLSAGSGGAALGALGRLGGGGGGGAHHWPLGRPGGGSSAASLYGGAGFGAGGGGFALGGAREGARLGLVSGFSRPQDPSSAFLGEESAIVFPPAGRNFGGGPSAAARAAGGVPAALGGLAIDGMEDFRFRGGGRKHIQIEDLDDPNRRIPAFRRNDDVGVERFLEEYARDVSKGPSAGPLVGGAGNRYQMPF